MAFCHAYHVVVVSTLAFARALGEAKLPTPNQSRYSFPMVPNRC